MIQSNEIRRLTAKWNSATAWPKRLDWIDIKGLRGWTGQRFELRYPIMAVVGENGVGKSTILHSATAVYTPTSTTPKQLVKGRGQFASDFFPNTTWDQIKGAEIRYMGREGDKPISGTIRKPTKQWLGNSTRPTRPVRYIDLSRIQPILARVGYSKITKTAHQEASSTPFDKYRLARLSQIMGRDFDAAKMALTSIDSVRTVPVLGHQGASYSGFHQGAGETTITELLQTDLPQYSLVLIDEVETSLHPRAQRRLIRDLAERARELELQIILTTHSPYILEELPFEARAQVSINPAGGRTVIYGVSPEFAMTKMDDVAQFECDVYVEDKRAQTMITEVLAKHAPALISRCQIIPYGAASVGQSLGIMVHNKRFPRPSVVFRDGDQGDAIGCIRLADDAPERVVFESLKAADWKKLNDRLGRDHAAIADALSQAMLLSNHHDWVNHAASPLMLGGDIVWQAMCAIWADTILNAQDAKLIVQPIEDALLQPTH
jgi:predicted ATPase